MEEVCEEMWQKRDGWIMRWLSLFLAAWCRIYINADVTVQLERLMDCRRHWCTSQVQYIPEVIQSDTRAQVQEPRTTCKYWKITSEMKCFYDVSALKHTAIISSRLHISLWIKVKAPTWMCFTFFLQSVTSLALKYSPRFLRLLILAYQSDTCDSSYAADWNRPQMYL